MAKIDARVRVIERVWGRDETFLAEHEQLYRNALDEQHLLRAQALIAQARSGEARATLTRVHGPVPALYQVSALLPSPLLRLALGLRRWVRKRMAS